MVVLALMAKRPLLSPFISTIALSASSANALSRCALPKQKLPSRRQLDAPR